MRLRAPATLATLLAASNAKAVSDRMVIPNASTGSVLFDESLDEGTPASPETSLLRGTAPTPPYPGAFVVVLTEPPRRAGGSGGPASCPEPGDRTARHHGGRTPGDGNG